MPGDAKLNLHTLTLSDELIDIKHVMKRIALYDKNVYIGLNFFDATINRVAEWIAAFFL